MISQQMQKSTENVRDSFQNHEAPTVAATMDSRKLSHRQYSANEVKVAREGMFVSKAPYLLVTSIPAPRLSFIPRSQPVLTPCHSEFHSHSQPMTSYVDSRSQFRSQSQPVVAPYADSRSEFRSQPHPVVMSRVYPSSVIGSQAQPVVAPYADSRSEFGSLPQPVVMSRVYPSSVIGSQPQPIVMSYVNPDLVSRSQPLVTSHVNPHSAIRLQQQPVKTAPCVKLRPEFNPQPQPVKTPCVNQRSEFESQPQPIVTPCGHSHSEFVPHSQPVTLSHMDNSLTGSTGNREDVKGGPLLKTRIACTAGGIILVFLDDKFRVDITADKAVRVLNLLAGTRMAVSSCREISALVHPTGNVYQCKNKVEIITNESAGYCKYAKIWQNQIFFSSDKSAVIYTLDEAGPRTTIYAPFSEMGYDFTGEVFVYSSNYGPSYAAICVDIAKSAYCDKEPNCWPIWNINGIRIKLDDSGVIVECEKKSFYMKSTLHGNAQISTANVYATASGRSQSTHLYVRRDRNRIYYDGKSFVARCGKRSAGFDQTGKFTVF